MVKGLVITGVLVVIVKGLVITGVVKGFAQQRVITGVVCKGLFATESDHRSGAGTPTPSCDKTTLLWSHKGRVHSHRLCETLYSLSLYCPCAMLKSVIAILLIFISAISISHNLQSSITVSGGVGGGGGWVT
jgi:hypothetical protein